jgi:hypothetical protein
MRTRFHVALVALSLTLQTQVVLGQGSLTPPGAPAPTMKTLSQIEPRTPISTLPFTINTPGSYYVTANLTNSGGHGITISSGNVVLDLGGNVLQGVGANGNGIFVAGNFTNIVICNGIVSGWSTRGVDAYSVGYPRQVRIENIQAFSNGEVGIYAEADSIIRNCHAMLNGKDGINCVGGEIIDCICRTNNSYGFNVQNCTVRNCRAEYNRSGGMLISQSRVLDCAVDNNFSTGIYSSLNGQNEIRRCHICSNGSFGGINLSANGPGYISDCLVGNNAGYGIEIFGQGYVISGNDCFQNSSGGIVLQESNNRVDGNHVVTPLSIKGISVTSSAYTNNVVVRNTVGGGGSAAINYSNTGGSDFGPIGSASSATSPWANISH